MWLPYGLIVFSILIAFVFAYVVTRKIFSLEEGTAKMVEVSLAIRTGANAYLRRQYLGVAIFFAVMFLLLAILSYFKIISWFEPFAFLTGGFSSGLAGFIGMKVATSSNARTAWAAKTSLNDGLRVAFGSGTVMGISVVGLGLLNLFAWFVILDWWTQNHFLGDMNPNRFIASILLTSVMGASSMALFARLGGGIFTKAADVGADLVGKIEAGIPEDDPRNPATIADNVGDNVGDVAGMGADLYESYIGSIVATAALGIVAFTGPMVVKSILLPMLLAAVGIIASIVGTFFVRVRDEDSQGALLNALRKGVYSSTFLVGVMGYFIVQKFMGSDSIGLWWAMIVGLVVGNVIGFFTEYFTSDRYSPTRYIASQAQTGSATVIIAGISTGMLSTAIPVLTIVIGILTSYFIAGGGAHFAIGLYGIGIAAVGMLSTLGITLATDAYGPVADNAGGIAQMAQMEPYVRKRTDALDMLGNTTAATGKGFAIGSAALTALALLAAYSQRSSEILIELNGSAELNMSLLNPIIISGLFIGAMLPFLFCSLSMKAVGRAAGKMVEEVRRQFREIKGIMENKAKPDYAACVLISTKAAQKEMILPSLLAILAPIFIGIVGGVQMVISLLAGATVTGFVLAVMMANAGGAWDNAKKHIENGAYGGKGSAAHKAAIVGDTVGDPFKDTSGPALNILIKLMSTVSVVFAKVVITINLWF
ncbi:sodium-translocating pyrophosphatase [PVC group bacterium]|nr:sodium-translocating pyrophosphatase [PVC group bacterium]